MTHCTIFFVGVLAGALATFVGIGVVVLILGKRRNTIIDDSLRLEKIQREMGNG